MIFNQSATLKVGSLEFNYPNFHMEWSYKVENDNSPSVLEITVFNLSDTNINSMKINDTLRVSIRSRWHCMDFRN